jgi:hypothetical protein
MIKQYLMAPLSGEINGGGFINIDSGKIEDTMQGKTSFGRMISFYGDYDLRACPQFKAIF